METKTNILDDIKSLIEENQLSFLIGAGFSRNISKVFPIWKELLTDAIWSMYGNGNDADRHILGEAFEQKVLQDHTLLEIASKFVSSSGFHETIDDYIEAHTPYLGLEHDKPVLMKDGDICSVTEDLNFECHRLLRQLDVPNIYTFNYDNALEFCLGDKRAFQRRKEIAEKELSEVCKKINDLDDQLVRMTKAIIPDISFEGRVPSIEISSEGILIGNATDNKRGEILEERNTLFSRRNELEQHIQALENKIEKAYLVINHSSEIALTSGGHNIYKIHGDLRIPPRTRYGFDGDKHTQYIITQEDYDTYEKKHSAFVNLMRIDLLRNCFCIIGVSGGDANFLAWINWVKDILDKAEDEGSKPKWSYYIYSGDTDLPRATRQMLENHFIRPVILKEYFSGASDDSQRIKEFLKAIQPNHVLIGKLTKLWKDVGRSSIKPVNSLALDDNAALTELCRLSMSHVFHKALSSVHVMARDVVSSSSRYLKNGTDIDKKKVLAAAVHCSLFPLYGARYEETIHILKQSRNRYVYDTYKYAHKRMLLLSNPSALTDRIINGDDYLSILKSLYLFDFPSIKDCSLKLKTGIDSVRLYSLQVLLKGQSSVNLNSERIQFISPQECVLAADWLTWIPHARNSLIVSSARKIVRKYSAYHLDEYFRSYLQEMTKKQDVASFGSVQDIIYLGGWHAGFENASVILNSIVYLGITFAGHTVLTDKDWCSLASELVSDFPYPIVFYTVARDSKENVAKRIAQELIYSEKSYTLVPGLLKRMMQAIVLEDTPDFMRGSIARFAKELLVAVPVSKWGKLFKSIAMTCLEYAKRSSFAIAKAIYQFVCAGAEYISYKHLKLAMLKYVLDNLSHNNILNNQLNLLAISAGRGLSVKDFEPLSEDLIQFGERYRVKRLESYVLINLAHLLSKTNKLRISDVLEKQALRDSNLAEAYAIFAHKNERLSNDFKQKLTNRKDAWQSGIGKGKVVIGNTCVMISRIDKILHFNDEQVLALYKDIRTVLPSIKAIFEMPNREVIDFGWMSDENTFREVVTDMLVFIHHHKQLLDTSYDTDAVENSLCQVYRNCLFGKTILQMLSDDLIYRAVRSMMTQIELKGIESLKTEYGILLSILLSRDSKDINICFRHISWVIREYEVFFNTKDFNNILISILDSYTQYFVPSKQRRWDIPGCEKELAEYHLTSIAQTLSKRGNYHPFWSQYKRVYYLKKEIPFENN